MSGQVSRGSAGEYQADEQAGVERLDWGAPKKNNKLQEKDIYQLASW